MTALLQMDVRCDRAAPAAVRHSISRLAPLGWIIGDTTFVASELVSNAVKHADSDPSHRLHVTLDQQPDAIRVSVQDRDEHTHPGQEHPAAPQSLGLQLVAALSRRWGTSHTNGYEVWAELAR